MHALLPLLLMSASLTAAPRADPLEPLYRRIAADLKAGRPLVVTVHVALCDNRALQCGSTRLGDGDQPRTNLYWGGAAGLKAWFDGRRGWKRVFRDPGDGQVVLERVAYRKHVRYPPPRWRHFGVTRGFDVVLVGLGYRGRRIGVAARRFVRDVSQDRGSRLRLVDGTVIRFGGASHVVGYAGHNHLMDERRFPWPAFQRKRPVGWFVLACMSAQYFAPRLTRAHTRTLLVTRVFMYPGAFTIEGIVRGILAARTQRGVFRQGARYYARYQKRSPRLIRRVFTHGGRQAYRARYPRR